MPTLGGTHAALDRRFCHYEDASHFLRASFHLHLPMGVESCGGIDCFSGELALVEACNDEIKRTHFVKIGRILALDNVEDNEFDH